MQDGKFHPHTDYKKGVRKSRDQSLKTKGIRMKKDRVITFGLDDRKLKVDFDPNATLETFASNFDGWQKIDAGTFRSWGGDRRINGKRFFGNVYNLGTNEIARPAGVSHKEQMVDDLWEEWNNGEHLDDSVMVSDPDRYYKTVNWWAFAKAHGLSKKDADLKMKLETGEPMFVRQPQK